MPKMPTHCPHCFARTGSAAALDSHLRFTCRKLRTQFCDWSDTGPDMDGTHARFECRRQATVQIDDDGTSFHFCTEHAMQVTA